MPHFQESLKYTIDENTEVELSVGEVATVSLNLQLETFEELIKQETINTHEVPNLFLSKTRIKLRALIYPALILIGNHSPTLHKKVCIPISNFLYPPGWFFSPTLQEEINWSWSDAQLMLLENRFALAKINDEIIAITGFKLGGKLADRRNVYELTKSYTRPPFRNKGINEQLEKLIIQMIKTQYPNSAIMTMSKNDSIISRYNKLDWQEISLEEYSKITRGIGRTGISADAIAVFQHWKCFLLDLIDQS